MLTVTAENTSPTEITLTISHEGGDDLVVADLEINASNSLDEMVTIDGTEITGVGSMFSVGETGSVAYTYGPDPEGKVITIHIIHVPSKQKIFSSSSIVVG